MKVTELSCLLEQFDNAEQYRTFAKEEKEISTISTSYVIDVYCIFNLIVHNIVGLDSSFRRCDSCKLQDMNRCWNTSFLILDQALQ